MKKKIAPKKGQKDFVTVGENNFGGHCLTGSSKKPKAYQKCRESQSIFENFEQN